MTRRAYAPRQSTRDLIAAILARPGIATVRTIAPRRGVTIGPARLRITSEGRDGNGRPIYSDFTLPDARAWLAAEVAADAPAARLEYLRGELDAERISMGELIELQGLADHIDPSDVQLLEAAGVPEFPDDDDAPAAYVVVASDPADYGRPESDPCYGPFPTEDDARAFGFSADCPYPAFHVKALAAPERMNPR